MPTQDHLDDASEAIETFGKRSYRTVEELEVAIDALASALLPLSESVEEDEDEYLSLDDVVRRLNIPKHVKRDVIDIYEEIAQLQRRIGYEGEDDDDDEDDEDGDIKDVADRLYESLKKALKQVKVEET